MKPTTHYLTLLFISFLISSLITPSLYATRCTLDDYKVLMQIKNALGNPYHLASWVPNTDCCDWYCLECSDTTNRVVELTIFSGNISGQIPSEIGDLPYLGNLSLRMSWLNLSGPIPGFLSELKNLTYLELNFNQFSSSIPSSLSEFTNLGTSW
ncbi:hypothetical protein ACHQM5_008264 [Ranunculus cassubicifolius]